jgi:hypothetical protein
LRLVQATSFIRKAVNEDRNSRAQLVHEMLIPIRWGDMDAMGHLNNNGFRYTGHRIDWMYAMASQTRRVRSGDRQRFLQPETAWNTTIVGSQCMSVTWSPTFETWSFI